MVITFAILIGCSGQREEREVGRPAKESQGQAEQIAPGAAPPEAQAAGSGKGIGPIKSVRLGPIDETAAARGKMVFDSKCAVCHKSSERYVGPPLAGVTKRRAPEWIMNLILNPEGMLKEDPVARKLLAEYLTPMTYQNVSEDDAMAILTYLRTIDEEGGSTRGHEAEEAHEEEPEEEE